MRINDILTETRSDEGIVSDIGSGVGKAVGATARGVGAVAGGVRGAWDAAKQGFQAGRNLVGGGGSSGASNPNAQRAQSLRVQADQLDGGNSAAQSPAPQSRAGRSGAGGQSRPYTGAGQAATAAADLAVTAASPDAAVEKLQQALQHLKGPDVERIRAMLKKRAGIAEGIMSSVAGGLGKMGRGYVDAKSAYQKGRGGDMTPQEIDLAIASMPKDRASELLNFFDTLYPSPAGSPADSGSPTTPSPASAPAAGAAPTTPGGAAGAGAAGNGASKPFQAAGSATPANASYKLNLPKPAAAAAKPATPAPQVRQTVPNPPNAKMDIKGLPVRNMEEGRKLHVHSSFLGMDL